MTPVKVISVGKELAVVLPQDVLAELKAGEGDTLIATRVAGGIQLSRSAGAVSEQIEAGRAFAREYAETLKALGK